MKKRIQRTLGIILFLALALSAGAAPVRFSLARYAQAQQPAVKLTGAQVQEPKEDYLQGAESRKRPWVAALETFSINISTWLIDRYAFNKSYSHIGWVDIKHNFTEWYCWDDDAFGESFAGHPFQGSQFYNSARSLGLSVWESIPYPALGYFMWGFFLENDLPSWNDQIFDIVGGINLGEVEYRLSSQVLDDSATGAERTGREILAFFLDPIREFNRIIYGDAFRTSSINRQKREPLHGNISLGGMLVSNGAKLSGLHFSPALTFDMVYGFDSSDIVVDHPFDMLVFYGDIRYSHFQSRGYFTYSTYGPWWAREWEGASGQRFSLGLFQHMDYLNNEAFEMGGMSTTAGFLSVFPLGGGSDLKFSIQAGGLFGGVRNSYVLVGDRNYDYCLGFTGKADVWFTYAPLGVISLHFTHFRAKGIEAAATTEADEGNDILTLFTAQYAFPLTEALGLTLEYGRFARRQHFEGHPETIQDSSRVGASLNLHF